jgi:hypothetical protein
MDAVDVRVEESYPLPVGPYRLRAETLLVSASHTPSRIPTTHRGVSPMGRLLFHKPVHTVILSASNTEEVDAAIQ